MKITWQPRRRGSIDYELLWLAVGSASLVLGFIWLRLNLPVPSCKFHDLTGLPCATCGATRSINSLSYGNIVDAAVWNPVVFGMSLIVALALGYCAVVVLFKLPRLRIAGVGGKFKRLLPWSFVGLLLVNWVYVLWISPKFY